MSDWHKQQAAELARFDKDDSPDGKRKRCFVECRAEGGTVDECQSACDALDEVLISRGQQPGNGSYTMDMGARFTKAAPASSSACGCSGSCGCHISESVKNICLAVLEDLRADTKDMLEDIQISGAPGGGAPEEDYAVAEEIADVIEAIYGDDAIDLLSEFADKGWDPDLHPRDRRGRFTRREDPQATVRASQLVGIHMSRPHGVSHEHVRQLLDTLGQRTIAELRSIRAAYGIRGGGRTKRELVDRIVQMLPVDAPSIERSRRWGQRD